MLILNSILLDRNTGTGGGVGHVTSLGLALTLVLAVSPDPGSARLQWPAKSCLHFGEDGRAFCFI